jgi:hypothetical protein
MDDLPIARYDVDHVGENGQFRRPLHYSVSTAIAFSVI